MRTLLTILALFTAYATHAAPVLTADDVTETTATLNWTADVEPYTVWRMQTGSYGQTWIPFANDVYGTSFAITKSVGYPWLDTYRVSGSNIVVVPYIVPAPLDPTEGGALPKFDYVLATSGAPDYTNPGGYLDHSCGYWTPAQYSAERDNGNGTSMAAFRFKTTCSTGGRGTRPKVFETCWFVTFSSGTVVDRQLQLYATWRVPALAGQPAVACPALE